MPSNALSFRFARRATCAAALLSGSTLAMAQETAPVIAAPPAPVTAAPTPVAPMPSVDPAPTPKVVPPPAVSTLPRANDTVNASAAQEAAAETAERRRAAASPAAAPVRSAQRQPAAAAETRAPVGVAEPVDATADIAVPSVDAIEPAQPVAPASIASSPVAPAVPDEGIADENDVTLVGGIAAALAALGLGAAFASRRRRKTVTDNRQPAMAADRDFGAPAPIKEDPAFQQFAARPSVAPAMTAPAADRVLRSKPVTARPDVPVTDPLFSRTVAQTPITDPMFAPRKDVEIPITDPMFAHMSDYKGISAPSKPARASVHSQPSQHGEQAANRPLADVERAR